jgi:NAD(P)-dependent dehydrogenase (short-subunit alcohol dehydrogenase family)
MRNPSRPEGAELLLWAEREGVDMTLLDLDVTSESSCKRAVATVLEQAGAIDLLVNSKSNDASAVSPACESQARLCRRRSQCRRNASRSHTRI